jgi:hypothetical protein
LKWTKLGRVYAAGDIHPKLRSHSANPLAVFLCDDIYRIFFSGRDVDNRSSVGYVDLDIVRLKVVNVCHEPAFEHGPPGSFFSHGVSIGNCYEAGGRRYMLFMGWRTPSLGHWYGEIGRLVVEPDLSLRLEADRPFMALDDSDGVSLSYPWVTHDDASGFRMWYGSTRTWDAGNGGMLHVINHAESDDGHVWRRRGLSVPYAIGVAQAFSRPTVVRGPSGDYEMWFSYRDDIGAKYRIGRASSTDGEKWRLRLDEAGIDVSAEGWDSEMIEYPFVFDHAGVRYMLYCGNGYGRTGFGAARLELASR